MIGAVSAPIIPIHSTDESSSDDLARIITAFAARHPHARTAREKQALITRLFTDTGRYHPRELTEADLVSWCAPAHLANNSVRQRISAVRTFLRWCVRNGHAERNIADEATGPDSPIRHRAKTSYGRLQAANPGRWLTHDEAFGSLLGACDVSTDVGLRDDIVIRLGLLGLRAGEIAGLRLGDLNSAANPATVTFTGKGHKGASITLSATLRTHLDEYLRRYQLSTGSLSPYLPLVCRQVRGTAPRPPQLDWGVTSSRPAQFIRDIVKSSASRAGLGHLAPHDLRRTAAGILHRATDEHGRHEFDLRDIQTVLRHSDPATTVKCYLDPMDKGAIVTRAAGFLDG